jgi:hypothetical protein
VTYALLSRVLFPGTQLHIITINDLKARRNAIGFIIETAADDVSNVHLGVVLHARTAEYTFALYETQNVGE